MKVKNATIGVIGFGNFGKVVCKNLFPDNSIVVFSRKKSVPTAKNVTFVSSLKELVEKADIIIPCVPMRNFEEVIQQIQSFLKKTSIIIDICSVKEYPITVMKKYVPHAQVIATHPMFGPNSIEKRKGILKGLPVVMSNVSTKKERYDKIKQHFLNLTLDVIEMDPIVHDKLSAKSQFFALTIGALTQKLTLRQTPIDTPGSRAIIEAMSYMGADRHIIEDMVAYNKYCLPMLDNMIEVLSSLKKGKPYA